jgi:hypothetical protein
MMGRKNAMLSLSIVLGLGVVHEVSSSSSSSSLHQYQSMVRMPRGGASMVEAKPKTKKKKNNKRKEKTPADLIQEKEAIQEALKEKDAAKALGDAIRYDPLNANPAIIITRCCPRLTSFFNFLIRVVQRSHRRLARNGPAVQ